MSTSTDNHASSSSYSKSAYCALFSLVIQNSCLVLLGRYLRLRAPDERFSVSVFVFVCELLKIITSLCFEAYSARGLGLTLREVLQRDIFDRPRDAAKMFVPSLLYVFQNNVLYLALDNLSAPVFQVTYQSKTLTTALFSVLMLGKRYSPYQWLSLVLLAIGVSIITLEETQGNEQVHATHDYEHPVVGLVAVFSACFSSGFAGVYFEWALKDTSGGQQPVSLWIRNIQLGVIGAGINFLSIVLFDWGTIVTNGAFHGFSALVWLQVGLSAFGGLLVAVVIKYADNMLKVIGVALSVVLSCALSSIWLGTTMTNTFIGGAVLIVTSSTVFTMAPKWEEVLFTDMPLRKEKQEKR